MLDAHMEEDWPSASKSESDYDLELMGDHLLEDELAWEYDQDDTGLPPQGNIFQDQWNMCPILTDTEEKYFKPGRTLYSKLLLSRLSTSKILKKEILPWLSSQVQGSTQINLPRPHKDVPPIEGRLQGFSNHRPGITQDLFMVETVEGHLHQFIQKPSYKCEVKTPRAQEAVVPSEINTMLMKETIKIGLGNKGIFTYPFMIPKKKQCELLQNDCQASLPYHNMHHFSKWSSWERSGKLSI